VAALLFIEGELRPFWTYVGLGASGTHAQQEEGLASVCAVCCDTAAKMICQQAQVCADQLAGIHRNPLSCLH
jgi:hypothetical protein